MVEIPIDRAAIEWGMREVSRLGSGRAALQHHGVKGGSARRWYLPYEGGYVDAKAVWRLALDRCRAPPSFRYYDTARAQKVMAELGYVAEAPFDSVTSDMTRKVIEAEAARAKTWREILARPQQTRFREKLLLELGCCAVSGVSDPAVLEAAHIVPVHQGGSDAPSNGMLLRVDLHRLFDALLIDFSDDFDVLVSPSLTAEMYQDLHGAPLLLSEKQLDERREALAQRRFATTED